MFYRQTKLKIPKLEKHRKSEPSEERRTYLGWTSGQYTPSLEHSDALHNEQKVKIKSTSQNYKKKKKKTTDNGQNQKNLPTTPKIRKKPADNAKY